MAKAVESEKKTISNTVKKPFLPDNFTSMRRILGTDKGEIENESYSLTIAAYGPYFNVPKLQVFINLFRNNLKRKLKCWL